MKKDTLRRRRNSYSSTTDSHDKFDGTDESSEPESSFRKFHRPRSRSEMTASFDWVDRAPPIATTNKTPIYEYYGFVMYLGSYVVLGIYLLWAYLPDDILHRLGISYYPNRYWALAVPTWLMTLTWLTFAIFISLNLVHTPPLSSITCMTDEHANVLRQNVQRSASSYPSDWIPELHDLPVQLVNDLLYPPPHVDDR